MSSSPTPSASTARSTTKKILVPKVWKRPHSTIYGKNVEFGSSLYSDKIGELNGRKFNSELPWTLRNSGSSSLATSSSYGNQSGYLSNLLLVDSNRDKDSKRYDLNNYSHVLELTNPSRLSKNRARPTAYRRRPALFNDNNNNNLNDNSMISGGESGSNSSRRIDFYDDYQLTFNDEIKRLNENSLLRNEPILTRKVMDKHLDFDYELGLFVPNYNLNDRNSSTPTSAAPNHVHQYNNYKKTSNDLDINTQNASFVPTTSSSSTITSNLPQNHQLQQNEINYLIQPNPIKPTSIYTNLLPKHDCQLTGSPYGPSADGRKLSLGSINPHSYRPSLPHKTTVAHSSDGEEFEFQDKSSPFYTDR